MDLRATSASRPPNVSHNRGDRKNPNPRDQSQTEPATKEVLGPKDVHPTVGMCRAWFLRVTRTILASKIPTVTSSTTLSSLNHALRSPFPTSEGNAQQNSQAVGLSARKVKRINL